LHGHGEPGATKIHTAAGYGPAGLDEPIDRRRIADRNVEGFAGFGFPDHVGIHLEPQIDRVAGRARKLLTQLAHRCPWTVAAQDLEGD
jgi:hypothetical protein